VIILIGMIAGLLILYIKTKVSIAYTPILMLIGFLIGLFSNKLGFIGEAMYNLTQINSKTI
jgi:hypothetical protein